MKISLSELTSEVLQLRNNILNRYLDKIVQINNSDFIFSFSKMRTERFFLSLNANSPFFVFAKKEETQNVMTPFLQVLRKEILHGQVVDVCLINEDYLLEICFKTITPTYQTVTRILVVELITNHPNLLLMDENRTLIAVYKPSSSIKGNRVLLRKFPYIPPQKCFTKDQEKESNKAFTDVYQEYRQTLKSKTRAFQFPKLFSLLKQKPKSLLRKKAQLIKEYQHAETRLLDLQKGNLLLTYQNEIPANSTSVVLENIVIDYDPQKSPSGNANHYFKSYRKYRNSLDYLKQQLDQVEVEMAYLESIKRQVSLCESQDLIVINQELVDQGYLPGKLTKAKSKPVKAYQPYYVISQGEKIAYGKNNYQNDYLSFTLAKKNFHFFHVKARPSSHVIIMAPNPSKELILAATSLALILSKLESGEVIHALVKDLKKGGKPGLVKISKYQNIYLNNIDSSIKLLLKDGKRF